MSTDLIEELAQFSLDPLGFVLFAFPWSEPGELENRVIESWQREFLDEVGELLRSGEINFVGAVQMARTSGHGVGKALDNETIIDAPSGRRRWGDLKVGDFVFGKNGLPTRIIAVHPQGKKQLYRVKFDDGSFVDCCEDHVWAVRGRQHRRNDLGGYWNLSVKELLRRGVLRKNGKSMARQWEIPTAVPPIWPDSDLPVEPYTFGIWLGDGNQGRITTTDDIIKAKIISDGYSISENEMQIGVYGLKVKLRELEVLDCKANSKYVPKQYKYTTPFNRAELLRGLLDTDGECNDHGSIIFSSVSFELVNDVIWLARSLGGKAQMQPAVKKPFYRDYDGNKVYGQDCYRCTIQMPYGFKCFYANRKQDRVREVQDRYLTRWIDAIEPLGERPCLCITVEADDGLFIANDLIVTHNSALVSWMILWAMSTFEDTVGVVTANTETQLKTKTWVQLSKWYRLFIARDLFKMTATGLFSVDPEHEKTWRIDMVPWSERNTEAFAGLHNQGKRIIVVFDEASAIPDPIWEVTEGALTDLNTQILWIVFGNPTRNTGRFRDCFEHGKFSHRWHSNVVDSRTVSFTDKEQISRWIQDYGEDSDFVRVRVLGKFPRIDTESFIGYELALEAARRDVEPQRGHTLVLGVDVARFGDDASVIYPRKGRDARTLPPEVYYGLDTMSLVSRVVAAVHKYSASNVFVDEGGVGGGVVDRLRQLRVPVIAVDFGSRADGTNEERGVKYARKRDEIWGAMRDWLNGGAIPERVIDVSLVEELTGPGYGLNVREEIQLESKKDMRRRGVQSPNVADALACTFAFPVYIPPLGHETEEKIVTYDDYNPLETERIYA